MRIEIVCIGKIKEEFYRGAVAEYSKRLTAFCDFSVVELPQERLPDNPGGREIARALEREGRSILAKLRPGARVVALCVEGGQLSSEEMAGTLMSWSVGGVSCVQFVIGSSFGLSGEVKSRADLRLSMSRMTLPHQLCRVVLCEQIYRAMTINHGAKYHK